MGVHRERRAEQHRAHLEENLGAGDVALTPEEVELLDGLAAG